MNFEYKNYQKVRRVLQIQKRQMDMGQSLDPGETLEQAARLMEMVDALRFMDQQLGIFNLDYCTNRIRKLTATGQITDYVIGYFDMRGFSLINNDYGREMGTELMRSFVMGLQRLFKEVDEFVSRVSGDNFVAVFKKERQEEVIRYLTGTEISVDGTEDNLRRMEAVAGYYRVDQVLPGMDSGEFIQRAKAACRSSKNGLGRPYRFWDSEMREKQEHRRNIENIFKESMEKGEFQVFYQPKVNLRNYSLAGAEALCRWMHDGRIMQPDDFIPILEESYNICELDFYMLERVCQDIHRWQEEGRQLVRVSVNLSRRHMDNEQLLGRVMEIIDRYRVPHEFIEIELTETTTDVEFTDLRRIVFGFQEENVSTSVDDFGVGYSSLNLIRELPWNVLKIDKSFLPKLSGADRKKDVMFHEIVALAQNLGLECIVEGVETAEQVEILKRNNCFMAQGFFFDRPLPVNEFENRMAGPEPV